MVRGRRPIRFLYAAYAASVLAVACASLLAGALGASISVLVEVLSAGWIFVGIAWVVGGFLYAPRIGTYLGPGGGVILWGAGAPAAGISPVLRPDSSPEVLADLGEKLSRGANFATLLAIFGFLLLVAGALVSMALWLGAMAGAAILVLAMILMASARGRRVPPRPV